MNGCIMIVVTNKESLSKLDFDAIPIDTTWNLAESKELKMHSIHAYPAKFPSFITTKALEYANQQNIQVDTMADIFCGCGTVAFEARRNGKNFWGCDINPVATLIAKVKSRQYDNATILKKYNDILDFANKTTIGQEEILQMNERIRYWFFDQEIGDLLRLKKAIYQAFPKSSKNRDFFLIAFSNILKPTSKWLTKSIKPQIDPNKVPQNTFKAFEKQVKLMMDANQQNDTNENPNVEIENISFLEKKFKQSFVDMIVTSPPYVTSYEYADLHQLSTLWLDYVDDFRSLREGTIGSLYHETNFVKDAKELNGTADSIVFNLYDKEKRKAKLVAKYFVDMQKSIKKCYSMINQNGLALFVIGNTEYKNVKINNAKHLVESMIDNGFREVEISRRKISNKILSPYRDENGKFTNDKNSRQVYAEEFIVIGKK